MSLNLISSRNNFSMVQILTMLLGIQSLYILELNFQISKARMFARLFLTFLLFFKFFDFGQRMD